MARCIEQVHDELPVLELHHRRGDRDTSLLFEFHPVGGGITARLTGTHSSRFLDSAAVMKKLLGEGSLTRVRVRDDGKGTSPLYLAQVIRHKTVAAGMKSTADYNALPKVHLRRRSRMPQNRNTA